MGQYFGDMGVDCDSVVQHFYDEVTQTLRVHVLSEAELDTLAGHCADICSCKTRYLCSDARPVFPEERLLAELLLGRPMAFHGKSVWASRRGFYVDGVSVQPPSALYAQADPVAIRAEFERLRPQNSPEYFKPFIDHFIAANRARLEEIRAEAIAFVRAIDAEIKPNFRYTSFSGGKDSSVTAHLVRAALGDLPHIFGDTTLEFPATYAYVERFRQSHDVLTARNDDRDFYEMCETIGPPSRTMRWCCTMFKTGPVARIVDKKLQQGTALAFLGIRQAESVQRGKYERVNRGDAGTKIRGQVTASPIFAWSDADVWLYLLANQLDFNEAYRLGYSRAGCFCCPNNSERNQFLSSVFMPEQSQRWQTLLLRFAKKARKSNPEAYVRNGYWKARIGGQGLRASDDLAIRRSECTTEENAQVYRLTRPVDTQFWNLLSPLGRVEPGRKLLDEVLVLDHKTGYPLLAASPHGADGLSVKIKAFDGGDAKELQRRCGYQVRKFNACQRCLKCEALCRFGAISVTAEGYLIDEAKCQRCGACTMAKYLEGGCLMSRYLRIPKEERTAA
jgi:phosphoadenosine phosphosulfate reductase